MRNLQIKNEVISFSLDGNINDKERCSSASFFAALPATRVCFFPGQSNNWPGDDPTIGQHGFAKQQKDICKNSEYEYTVIHYNHLSPQPTLALNKRTRNQMQQQTHNGTVSRRADHTQMKNP